MYCAYTRFGVVVVFSAVLHTVGQMSISYFSSRLHPAWLQGCMSDESDEDAWLVVADIAVPGTKGRGLHATLNALFCSQQSQFQANKHAVLTRL